MCYMLCVADVILVSTICDVLCYVLYVMYSVMCYMLCVADVIHVSTICDVLCYVYI